MWKKMALTVMAVLGVAAAPALANADEPCAQEQAVYAPVAQPVYWREGNWRDGREDYLRWRQRERWDRARRFERWERVHRFERGYGYRW
jgi:hypothetical protein